MGTVRLAPMERRLIESRLDVPECLFEVLGERLQGPFDPDALSLVERKLGIRFPGY